MIVKIKAGDLIALGLWLKYCDITGTNEWAINEGLIDSDKYLSVTISDDSTIILEAKSER